MTPYTYEFRHMAGWSLHTPTRKLLFGVVVALYCGFLWRLNTTGASAPADGAFPWGASASTLPLPLLAVGFLIFDHLQGGRYFVTISEECIAWRVGTYSRRHRIVTVAGAHYTLPFGELPYTVVGKVKSRLEELAGRRPLERVRARAVAS